MRESTIRHLLYTFFALLDLFAKRVVPPRLNQLVYQSSPDYSDNAYYLYLHVLKTRENIIHVWILENYSLEKQIEKDFKKYSSGRNHRLKLVSRRSFKGYWQLLRSSYVFHTHGIYPFIRSSYRRKVVNLWHGMPIKCIGALNQVNPNPNPTYGTHQLATSDFFRYVIAQAFQCRLSGVIHTRLPRCDAFDGQLGGVGAEQRIRRNLGLSDQRIIAWLPTYRSEGGARTGESFLDDLDASMLARIDEIARRNNCFVVIKLHPYDPLNNNLPDWGYNSVRILSAHEWERLGIPLYDFLAVTSGLLTDISSVIFDYQLTGRPIGIIAFNEKRYLRDLVFPIEWLTGCPRYLNLSTDKDIEEYVRLVVDVCEMEFSGDYSSIFVSPPHVSGSETVLSELGL